MYENMTVLNNKEYANLVIKAFKYDLLRKKIVDESGYVSEDEKIIFELTQEELDAIRERR